MTEEELRMLVREAIAKQLGGARVPTAARVASEGGSDRGHSVVSFAQFGISSGPDGTCIIEPAVMCNHCGYCKSYGH